MIINKVIFKRVKEENIFEIRKLFKKVYFTTININYYNKKYLYRKTYNAFIAKLDGKIIGHVGFVKIESYIKGQYYFSRHSSFIDPLYQRLGIYNQMCNYAFKVLKKINIIGTVIWPNDKNMKVKFLNYNIYYFTPHLIYIRNYKNSKLLNKNHRKFYLEKFDIQLTKDEFSIYRRDKMYFLKLFKGLPKNNFYIYKDETFYIIYTLYKKNDKITSYIMAHNTFTLNSQFFLKEFITYMKNRVHFIKIFAPNKSNFFTKMLIKNSFYKDNNRLYNIGFIPFKKNNNFSKLSNKTYFQMGDTDNFHVIN